VVERSQSLIGVLFGVCQMQVSRILRGSLEKLRAQTEIEAPPV